MPPRFFLITVSWLVLGLAQLAKTQADEQTGWMQYRGPDGAGRYLAPDPLPEKLDFDSNLIWKIRIAQGHSSPIVVQNSIVLTGYEPGKLSTLCFELDTGKLRWQRDLEVKVFERTHPQHGPATPTPVSDGKRIFATFGSFGVVAYDLDGTELWRDEKRLHRNMFGSASSPIIVDRKLLVFAGNEDESLLQALDPLTGKVIWERRKPGPASSWSTPVVWTKGADTTVLVYEPFHLRCISMVDGREIWSVPGLADEPITLPQVNHGLIITTSYNMRLNNEVIGLPSFEALLEQCDVDGDGMIDLEESKSNQSVLSRPDADGQGDHPLRMFFREMDANKDGRIQTDEYPRLKAWVDSFEHANGFIALRPGEQNTVPKLAWQHEVGVPECPSPIVLDGKLFAVRNGGVVTCLDAETGKLLFQERLASGGPYYAGIVSGDKKIYLASQRGRLTILSTSEQPRVLATADLGESVHATPVLASGYLIVRSQNQLWLFGGPPDRKKE